MARLRLFLSEAPLFFIAVVVGIALMFKVAIGWAKSKGADDLASDKAVAKTSQPTAAAAPSTLAKSATPAVTADPRPAATATVPSTPRKKPRPRH